MFSLAVLAMMVVVGIMKKSKPHTEDSSRFCVGKCVPVNTDYWVANAFCWQRCLTSCCPAKVFPCFLNNVGDDEFNVEASFVILTTTKSEWFIHFLYGRASSQGLVLHAYEQIFLVLVNKHSILVLGSCSYYCIICQISRIVLCIHAES